MCEAVDGRESMLLRPRFAGVSARLAIGANCLSWRALRHLA